MAGARDDQGDEPVSAQRVRVPAELDDQGKVVRWVECESEQAAAGWDETRWMSLDR